MLRREARQAQSRPPTGPELILDSDQDKIEERKEKERSWKFKRGWLESFLKDNEAVFLCCRYGRAIDSNKAVDSVRPDPRTWHWYRVTPKAVQHFPPQPERCAMRYAIPYAVYRCSVLYGNSSIFSTFRINTSSGQGFI